MNIPPIDCNTASGIEATIRQTAELLWCASENIEAIRAALVDGVKPPTNLAYQVDALRDAVRPLDGALLDAILARPATATPDQRAA